MVKKTEFLKHWAEDLVAGDVVKATIRMHPIVRSRDINLEVMVIDNNTKTKIIKAFNKSRKNLLHTL